MTQRLNEIGDTIPIRFDRLITATRTIHTGRVRGKGQARKETRKMWARRLPISSRDQQLAPDGGAIGEGRRRGRWHVRWQADWEWSIKDGFIDEQDGRRWYVDGLQELGRERLVELYCSTSVASIDATRSEPRGTYPRGQFTEDRDKPDRS